MSATSTGTTRHVTHDRRRLTSPTPVHGAPEPDPRIARSRAKIVHAATELLIEGGMRAFTADAVAEQSGVAKSTLYRHWPSIDDLLIDVLRANVPDSPPVDTSAGFEPALRQWISHAVATLGSPDWARILPVLLELRTKSPEMAALLEQDFSEKLVTMEAILRVGATEGRVPRRLDARLVTQTLVGPLVLAALSGGDTRLDELATFVVDRFLAAYPEPTPAPPPASPRR